MSILDAMMIVLAGLAAGGINTIVGSGTLITFPTLLFFGYPPVSANISNTLGLVAGGMTGAWGYRKELGVTRGMLSRLAPAAFVGAVLGALLLLVLPESAFEAIVPMLIAIALLLVISGPRLNRWAAEQHADRLTAARWAVLLLGILLTGMYGGYFGAAQGVLQIGLMSVLLPLGIQEINGVKNVLTLVVNLVAACTFVIVEPAHIDWLIVILIASGAFFGGLVGARLGRSMPPWLLRTVIVLIGAIAITVLMT